MCSWKFLSNQFVIDFSVVKKNGSSIWNRSSYRIETYRLSSLLITIIKRFILAFVLFIRWRMYCTVNKLRTVTLLQLKAYRVSSRKFVWVRMVMKTMDPNLMSFTVEIERILSHYNWMWSIFGFLLCLCISCACNVSVLFQFKSLSPFLPSSAHTKNNFFCQPLHFHVICAFMFSSQLHSFQPRFHVPFVAFYFIFDLTVCFAFVSQFNQAECTEC